MANEKTKADRAAEPPSQPASSTSGEHVRKTAVREPLCSQSTTRRALRSRERSAPEDEPKPVRKPARPTSLEETTLRSTKLPQRIRMSLRMRRVAAASASDGSGALCAQDRVGLRLAGRDFELPIGKEVVAGRSAECDILIADRHCSRQHAVFSRSADGAALVRDLGSTNGTYVNGVRLATTHRLGRGDWTTIGNETLELCVLPSAPRGLTPTIPAGPRRKTTATPAPTVRPGAKTDPLKR